MNKKIGGYVTDQNYNHQTKKFDKFDNGMKKTFALFLSVFFPTAKRQLSVNEISEMGTEFHNHLDGLLNDEQKANIIPKHILDILENTDNPLRKNGFHPAYVLHFNQWVKESLTESA